MALTDSNKALTGDISPEKKKKLLDYAAEIRAKESKTRKPPKASDMPVSPNPKITRTEEMMGKAVGAISNVKEYLVGAPYVLAHEKYRKYKESKK